MLDGFLELVSGARVGFVGLFRDEETLEPVEYYVKLPSDLGVRDAIVLDPMLATGNSLAAAITAIKKGGARSVSVICLVSAPQGIERVQAEHPDVVDLLRRDRPRAERPRLHRPGARGRRRPPLRDEVVSPRLYVANAA